MTLAAVLGQSRALKALRSALAAQAVHHAYLFAGPEGVGKEMTAVGLVQALACLERPKEGCGECSTCVRIARKSHPDVTWVMPQEEMVSRGLASKSDFAGTPSREIRVEQIRALQERLSVRPLESERNVAIVASAEQMNAQAQNAFLKTLEEPPSVSMLILVASSPDRLLATIRSRCSRIQFGPLPLDFIAAHLRTARNLDPANADLVAAMSGGSMSRGLRLDVDALGDRKDLIALFEALGPHDVRALLAFSEQFGATRERAEDALEVLRIWIRDLLAVQVGSDQLVHRDLHALAGKVAPKYSEAALHRRHALIERAANAIAERNGSPRLQLERMLIEMSRTA